jgi:hypothetical protein
LQLTQARVEKTLHTSSQEVTVEALQSQLTDSEFKLLAAEKQVAELTSALQLESSHSQELSKQLQKECLKASELSDQLVAAKEQYQKLYHLLRVEWLCTPERPSTKAYPG